MKVGIVAYQGSVEEHALMAYRAMKELGYQGEVVEVKLPEDLKDVDALIIPGGESTTIGIVAKRAGLLEPLTDKIREGTPVLGTCAGAIMLAKEVTDAKVGKRSQPLIGLMDVKVIRNYYGRQRESFEAEVDLTSINEGRMHTVFIRAPAIVEVKGRAMALSKLDNVVVFAQQDNMIATTFHPELSNSTAIHKYRLRLAKA
ncbi:pyridoxal 5'-phosphate synthase glutaminase subunit PdxT [Sulfolobales archaeon SCGC AB-777_J03]|nr:pyridoxal 5'-phosphate synthase glutaminase subunit PdxT [Sulfolobales archaeon SCGC AB-777_J03]